MQSVADVHVLKISPAHHARACLYRVPTSANVLDLHVALVMLTTPRKLLSGQQPSCARRLFPPLIIECLSCSLKRLLLCHWHSLPPPPPCAAVPAAALSESLWCLHEAALCAPDCCLQACPPAWQLVTESCTWLIPGGCRLKLASLRVSKDIICRIAVQATTTSLCKYLGLAQFP